MTMPLPASTLGGDLFLAFVSVVAAAPHRPADPESPRRKGTCTA